MSGVKNPFPEAHNPLFKVHTPFFYFYHKTKYLLIYSFVVSIGKESKGNVSMLIYEWEDFKNLGAIDKDTGEVIYTERKTCFF